MAETARPAFDLTPFERWEAVTLRGEHVGFLFRRLAEGVLTSRMGFAPTAVQRAATPDLPERFFAQSQVAFTDDGATWVWTSYEDSATEQRVRIERERAGLGEDVVPSYAEHLLMGPAAEAALTFVRLEEASPLQGPVRMPEATLRPAGGDAGAGAEGGVRVDVVSEGVVIGSHHVREGAVTASDWGGGTASAPVAGRDEALAGLGAQLVTVAGLPVE